MQISGLEKNVTRVGRLLIALVAMSTLVLSATSAGLSESKDRVKFRLRTEENEQDLIHVNLSFNLEPGERVGINAFSDEGTNGTLKSQAEVEFYVEPKGEYEVKPVEGEVKGIEVDAEERCEVSVDYDVRLSNRNSPEGNGEAPGYHGSPLPIVEHDIKVFNSSSVLFPPRDIEHGSVLGGDYRVDFDIPGGDSVLVPWEPLEEEGAYVCDSEEELLNNYVCFGKIDVIERSSGKSAMNLGFSSDYEGAKPEILGAYAANLSSLFEGTAKILGDRPRLPRYSVLVCSAERFGLGEPESETLLDSLVLFDGGEILEGGSSAAASRGLFNLWNHWSLLPESGGEAQWFQAGLPWLYCYRIPVLEGQMEGDTAYEEFSELYTRYITNPLAQSTSLVDAGRMEDPEAEELLADKGAVVCAAMDKLLREQTQGSKGIDWLANRMSADFNHFDGEDYSLVDIEELLENTTKESWARFFSEKVRGTVPIDASEFSTSDLFGATSTIGAGELEFTGSKERWFLLLGAVIAILLIPLIFSSYVRRAVKLDVEMPKILPPDDDEPEEPEGDEKPGSAGSDPGQ